jgi:hypothetical protein
MKVNTILDFAENCYIKNAQIEELASLPVWTPADESRIIYVTSTATLYYGSHTGWVTMAEGTYVFVQTVPVIAWNIHHSLGTTNLNVEIYNQNNEVIIPDKIIQIDANNTRIEFKAVQTGKAILSSRGSGGMAGITSVIPWVVVETALELETVLNVQYPMGNVSILMKAGTYQPTAPINISGKQNLHIEGVGKVYLDGGLLGTNALLTNITEIFHEINPLVDHLTGLPIENGATKLRVPIATYNYVQPADDLLIYNLSGKVVSYNRILTKSVSGPDYVLHLAVPIFGSIHSIDKGIIVRRVFANNISFKNIQFQSAGAGIGASVSLDVDRLQFEDCIFYNISGSPPILLAGMDVHLNRVDFNFADTDIYTLYGRINKLTFRSFGMLNVVCSTSHISDLGGEFGTMYFSGERVVINGIISNNTGNISLYHMRDGMLGDGIGGQFAMINCERSTLSDCECFNGVLISESSYSVVKNSVIQDSDIVVLDALCTNTILNQNILRNGFVLDNGTNTYENNINQ